MSDGEHWRLCSSCKNPIGFGTPHYVCGVSTCNRKRTGLTFCSLSCWEAHLPQMRHREAWAEERQAPSKEAWGEQQVEEQQKSEARKQRAEAGPAVELKKRMHEDLPRDILIVVSKLKNYIRARSGMNTSDGVTEALSDIVRDACDDAVRRARQAERRTVMARDFELDS